MSARAVVFFVGLLLAGAPALGDTEWKPVKVAGLRSQNFSELVKKEQMPLQTEQVKPVAEPEVGLGRVVVAVVVVLCLLTLVALGVRAFRKQTFRQGDRKYLIEKLSYCPVGPKLGVCLIKIGNELMLIGVGGQQVTFLSSLPRLQSQYDEETKFERANFKEAVEEEFRRIQQGSRATV